jgi:hypothetical protein
MSRLSIRIGAAGYISWMIKRINSQMIKALQGLLLSQNRRCEMENVQKETPETERKIDEIIDRNEQIKEEKIVNLIIEIIVNSTLKEYYETCDKISEVQPAGSK